MDHAEVQRWLRQTPFQPFRVFVRDGRIYTVTHPRMNLLNRTYINIGIGAPDLRPPICDHTEHVLLSEIERIEAIPQSIVAANS